MKVGGKSLPPARLLLFIALVAPATPSLAFFDPLSLAGRVITTTMDVRTKGEVKDDVEISAGANKRLLDDKQAEWKGVTLLVFARHVVIAGAVKTDEAKKLVEKIVRQDSRIRSVVNNLVVIRRKGDEGSLAGDTVLDTKINAALTTTKGVGSVNMRWKTVNGNVILMGVAQSKGEAKLTIATIRELKGVKSVKSHLSIHPKAGK